MKRNTAQLKEKLIETGIEEIKNNGIDAISLRTIAKKCGVTHGTPYRHFESKDGYLELILKHLSVFFSEELMQDVKEEKTAKEAITVMGSNYLHFSSDYPFFFEALFIKYPLTFLNISKTTLSTEYEIPGFIRFKEVVLRLIEEEQLLVRSKDAILHLWSFISGLAILANAQKVSMDLHVDFEESIISMLTIYIAGGKS